jgi:hypothetical protein
VRGAAPHRWSRGARATAETAEPAAELLPDARDGLTRLERVILVELSRVQAERGGASVPTVMLYGRVVERIDVSADEFQAVLSRLVGR